MLGQIDHQAHPNHCIFSWGIFILSLKFWCFSLLSGRYSSFQWWFSLHGYPHCTYPEITTFRVIRFLWGILSNNFRAKVKISHLGTCIDHYNLIHQIWLTNWWKHPLASSQTTQFLHTCKLNHFEQGIHTQTHFFRTTPCTNELIPCTNSWAEVQTKEVKV